MSGLPDPTFELSEEQIAFYHEHGYLAIDQITTSGEVESIREGYDEIFSKRAGREEGMEYDLAGSDEDDARPKLPQILEPKNYSEAFRNTQFESNAAHIARQLLGEGIEQRGSHAIFKPAGYGAPTPWHQDEAYWNPGKNYHSISVWMPLQEATLDNGCMQFLPGAQKLEVLNHHNIGNDPRVQGLELDDGQVDLSNAVGCPLPAGGATIDGGRMPHYTSANTSDTPRRAYILMFHVPQPLRDTPRDFYWQKSTRTYAAEKREAAKSS